ncbi:MAG: hypothetical protein CMO46_05690 [Verrucomicrobiales bacterium]|nr:hypothetical protein [Verrucomicrobiales bacterium]
MICGSLFAGEAEHDEDENPDENLWLYAKGTDVREDGSWEFKVNNIWRLSKNSGDYLFLDSRPELEYGITDQWTLGAELMIFHHDYTDVEWGPMVDTQGGPGGSFKDTQIGGWEINTKYAIKNAFEDDFGLSLGLGYEHRRAYRLDGGAIDQDTIAPQIYLQKSLMDDNLQVAFTGKLEFERRKSPDYPALPSVLEDEIAPDLAVGVSYKLKDRTWIGLEMRYQSDFLSPEEDGNPPEGKPSSWDGGDVQFGDQFQYGLYVGPTFHYASPDNWWILAGALFQIKGWSADGLDASNDGRNWDEHEKVHLGLTLGYEW